MFAVQAFDFGDHPFDAGTLRPAGCRATEIVVDHLDLRPAQRHQAIAHGILKRAALPVVQDLMSRRLTCMEQRLALQMMAKNLLRDQGRPPRPRSPNALARRSFMLADTGLPRIFVARGT